MLRIHDSENLFRPEGRQFGKKLIVRSWPLVVLLIIPYLYLLIPSFCWGRRKEVKREGGKEQRSREGRRKSKHGNLGLERNGSDCFTQPLGAEK